MQTISIIVPVFNAEQTISRCVDSLISQNTGGLFQTEILLVDDGSKDKSAVLLDEYAKEHENVKVFHNENHGVSYTRNFGIENSTGEYVMFCDSDDCVNENWCMDHFKAISEYPDSWTVSGAISINPDGSQEKMRLSGGSRTIPFDDYFYVFKAGISGFPWNHIFSKEKLEDVRFDEKISCGEDVMFNISYMKSCDSIAYIDAADYCYYRADNTLSTKYDKNFFFIHKPLYELRKQYISSQHKDEFSSIYYHIFLNGLRTTFDRRNKDGFFKKISFNNRILHDPAFTECLDCAETFEGKNSYTSALRSGNYFRVYLLEKIYNIKKGRG